jgi:uncharacterized protein (TIGR02466 family)
MEKLYGVEKMSTYLIDSWFPKTIYYVDNILDNTQNLYEDAISFLNEKGYKRFDDFYVDSTHSITDKLYEYKSFKGLKDIIDIHVENYKTELGLTVKSKINNMWINKSGKGDYNFPHSHAGSLISGVFYIKSTTDNRIIFYNDEFLSGNNVVSSNQTSYSHTMCYYSCVEGRLMLWRSNLIHGNPIQKNNSEKIITSFNYDIT